MTSWGSKRSGSGVWMRIGYDVSRTSVHHGSNNVKFTVKVYRDSNGIDDNQTLHFSSKLGGDYNYHASGSGKHLITTRSYTYSYGGSDYGHSHSQSCTATLNGVFNGTHPSVNIKFSIPKRPYARPANPTSVDATLGTGKRVTVNWVGHPTSGEPIFSTTIQYRRLDGGTWSSWIHSATVKSGSSSYKSGTLHSNHSYQYRVRSNGPGGSSSWATSGYIQMAGAPPTNVHAKVLGSGDDIKVTWDTNAYESVYLSFTIDRRVNGGSWSRAKTGYGQLKDKPYTSSWTDSNPGAGTNQYRVRIDNTQEGENSDWTSSNTVSTIVAPLAPTQLKPDGPTVDLNNDLILTWEHHDGGDGADQSHFKIQHAVGSGWEDVDTVASDVSSYVLPGGTWTNDQDYHKWRVATQGNTSEGYGPWSATATFYGSTSPTVSLQSGFPSTVLTNYPLTVAWEYQQDEDVPESTWQLEVWSGDDPETGDLLDSLTGGPGDTSEPTTPNLVLNGEFDDWTSGEPDNWSPWNANSTLSEETTDPLSGTSSLAITDAISANQGGALSDAIAVTPGTDYQLSLKFQGDGGTTVAALYFYDDTDALIESDYVAADGSSDEQDLTVTATAPDTASYLKVRLNTASVTAAKSVYDAIRVNVWVSDGAESVDVKYPFEDGSTYTIQLRSQSGDGLWSDWQQATFIVDLLPPADTTLDAYFDQPSGVMMLHVATGDTLNDNMITDPTFSDESLSSVYIGNATYGENGYIFHAEGTSGQIKFSLQPGDFVSPDSNWLPVKGGSEYLLTAYAYLYVDNESYIVARWVDGNGVVANVYSDTITGTGYKNYSFTWTAPETAVAVLPYFSVQYSDAAFNDRIAILYGQDVFFGHQTADNTASVLTFDVQRKIDDGQWITILQDVNIGDETTVADMTPILRGTNSYRLVLYSDAPSTATTDPVDVKLDRTNAIEYTFLSYGNAFENILRFASDPVVKSSPKRTQTSQPLLNRRNPILLQGKQRSQVLAISGTVHYDSECKTTNNDEDDGLDSPPEDWETAQLEAGIVCYRDPYGSRRFGMLSDMDIEFMEQNLDFASISFNVTTERFDEQALTTDDEGDYDDET